MLFQKQYFLLIKNKMIVYFSKGFCPVLNNLIEHDSLLLRCENKSRPKTFLFFLYCQVNVFYIFHEIKCSCNVTQEGLLSITIFSVQRPTFLSLEMILNWNEVEYDIHSAWNTLIWVFMICTYIFVVKISQCFLIKPKHLKDYVLHL